jgi:hypothetical protein
LGLLSELVVSFSFLNMALGQKLDLLLFAIVVELC